MEKIAKYIEEKNNPDAAFHRAALLGIDKMLQEFTASSEDTSDILKENGFSVQDIKTVVQNANQFIESIKFYIGELSYLLSQQERQYLVLVSRYDLTPRGRIHPREFSLSRQRIHQMWMLSKETIGGDKMRTAILAAASEAIGKKPPKHYNFNIEKRIRLSRSIQELKIVPSHVGYNASVMAKQLAADGYLVETKKGKGYPICFAPTKSGENVGIEVIETKEGCIPLVTKRGEKFIRDYAAEKSKEWKK